MNMRSAHFLALVLACICLPTFGDERPHIVLVMADDHGYGDTGYTGHPFVQTPHLDAMADRGVVFNRFYASAPVCSPTRASVVTGRHPFRTNVPNHGHYMRPHETTIAERWELRLRDGPLESGISVRCRVVPPVPAVQDLTNGFLG